MKQEPRRDWSTFWVHTWFNFVAIAVIGIVLSTRRGAFYWLILAVMMVYGAYSTFRWWKLTAPPPPQ